VKVLRYTFILLFILAVSGCAEEKPAADSRLMMDTIVKIKVFPSNAKIDAEGAIKESFAVMGRVQSVMDRFDETSEISYVNSREPQTVIEISGEISNLLRKSLDIYEISDGAFDITISPLLDMWKLSSLKGGFPDSEEIRDALSSIGAGSIALDHTNGFLIKSKPLTIDLSGIAKGYAVDNAVWALKTKGIDSGIIDAGGDLYCLGSAPDGKEWLIGVRNPREDSIIGTLKVRDKAVATSGDYQRYLAFGKARLPHIIDPRYGVPVDNGTLSVTVIANDCTTADGLATALMVLGPDEGASIVEGLSDVEAIWINQGKDCLTVKTSSGLTDLYESL